MKTLRLQSVLLFLLPSFIAAAIIGCSNGGNGDDVLIRLLNASPDSPALDFYIDDLVVATSTDFGEVSEYTEVDEATHRLRVNQNGQGTSAVDFSTPLTDATNYLLVVADSFANIDPILLTESRDTPDAGNFRIRAVHASKSLGAVDVYVIPQNDTLAGHVPNFSSVTYSNASNYDQVGEDDYVIYVTTAGTQTVLASTGVISFDDNRIWTLVVLDQSGGGTPPTLVLLSDRG